MITEMNSRELHRVELLAALHAQLAGGQEPLKPRLQTIPQAWRDWRMLVAVAGRLLTQIYETMPTNRLKTIEQLCANGEVVIRMKQIVKTDEFLPIHVSSLKALVNHAMAGTCTMCFEGRDFVKKCALRKALMEVAPPVDLNLGECPYRYVVEQNEEGKYL